MKTIRQYLAVNLASPQYSNLNKTVSQKDGRRSHRRLAAQELWFYMIGAAALLLALEWFTYHRGITV